MKTNKHRLGYNRSRTREYYVKDKREKEGYLSFRTAGSHGVADVVSIKPNASLCGDPNHFIVLLDQIKTSQKIKEFKEDILVIDTPSFSVNVNFLYFPVKNKKYYEKYAKSKRLVRRKPKLKTIKRTTKR